MCLTAIKFDTIIVKTTAKLSFLTKFSTIAKQMSVSKPIKIDLGWWVLNNSAADGEISPTYCQTIVW